ncbi:MAG: hypothetical protein HY855_13745 [Burkholderiales bacterium]|nr:hypothetical protein [Burkholderiales bacterium]
MARLMTLRRALLAAAAVLAFGPARAADAAPGEGPGGELRLLWQGREAAPRGPLAAANARWPGMAPATPDAWSTELELRHTLRAKVAGTPVSLAGNLLAWHERPAGGAGHGEARVNELYASADLGAWQLSAGKKVVGWDVGFGFRPNDVVQQEARRTLLASTPEGRPLLQLEHFGAERALSLVWVNPQHLNAADETSRGARESALALRGYQRLGALDAFAFARVGARTGASLGSAVSWVATDALELHGSLRVLQRHDAWALASEAGLQAMPANPWRQATRGGTSQWLLGASWTGTWQQSVMLEYWHDGSTLSDAAWDRWTQRSAALAAAAGPAIRSAGNLAWQATPMAASSLRRDNLFVRLAWQPEHWQLALDALITPADRGRLLTASVQWQGDRWRLNAAWRVAGGPADSLLAQVPVRRTLLLAATLAY